MSVGFLRRFYSFFLIFSLWICIGSSIFFIWKGAENGNNKDIERAVTDTSLALSGYYRSELLHLFEKLKNNSLDSSVVETSFWQNDLSPVLIQTIKNPNYFEVVPPLLPTPSSDAIQSVFKGFLSISGVNGVDGLILVAVPKENGFLSAFVNLNKISNDHFLSELSWSSQFFLIDSSGKVIIRFGDQKNEVDIDLIYRFMKSSYLEVSHSIFQDKNKDYFFGGFSRLGLGQLSILSYFPKHEKSFFLKNLKITLFFLFFLIGIILPWIFFLLLKNNQEPASDEFFSPEKNSFFQAKKVKVTVLYGSIKNLHSFVDACLTQADGEIFLQSLSNFFLIAKKSIEQLGGRFEKFSQEVFLGIWNHSDSDGSEIWRSLRSALEIRKKIFDYNEKKITEPILTIGMGVHTGVGIQWSMDLNNPRSLCIVGEVVDYARKLDSFTVHSHEDLFVSQEVWKDSEAKFIGELVENYYSISGYRDEKGELISVELSKKKVIFPVNLSIKSWLVNNGSHIIGPLNAKEIASRLFSQELDFDCECWLEGTAHSIQIRNAGIFSGSEDLSMSFWLYDGEQIHGPVSPRFIKTAIDHGAIQKSNYWVCEKSTVHGWTPISDWLVSFSFEKTNPLQDSLSLPKKKVA